MDPIRFTRSITVDGRPFAAGDEVDAAEILPGNLESILRCGYAVRIEAEPEADEEILAESRPKPSASKPKPPTPKARRGRTQPEAPAEEPSEPGSETTETAGDAS